MSRIEETFIAAVLLLLVATMVVIPVARSAAALMDAHANMIAEANDVQYR
jgi:hypothetical protein